MNKLRKKLERALAEAEFRRDNGFEPLICVVFGETGCGKTSIIREFLTDSDLSNYEIKGTSIKSRVVPEFSDLTSEPITFDHDEIDKLNESEIIFIDDYDFAPLETRNELLRLVKNLEVVDTRRTDRMKKLNKPLMFIIVLHVLSLKFDRFYEKLSSEEQKFFKVENLSDKAVPFTEDNVYVIPYRSDKKDCLEYIENKLDNKIDFFTRKNELSNEELKIKISNAEENKKFAKAILTDIRFAFTNFNQAKSATGRVVTARSFSNLFYYGGKINKSILLKNWNTCCDPDMKKVILEILEDHPELEDGEDYAEVKAEILKSISEKDENEGAMISEEIFTNGVDKIILESLIYDENFIDCIYQIFTYSISNFSGINHENIKEKIRQFLHEDIGRANIIRFVAGKFIDQILTEQASEKYNDFMYAEICRKWFEDYQKQNESEGTMKKKKHEITADELFEEDEEEKQKSIALHEEDVKNALRKNELRKNYKPKETRLSQILESGVISSEILQEKLKFSKAKADKVIKDLSWNSSLLWDKDHYIITAPEGVKGYFYNSADDEYELFKQIEDLTAKLKGIGHERLWLLSENAYDKLMKLKFQIEDDYVTPLSAIPLSDYYGAISNLFEDTDVVIMKKSTLSNTYHAYDGFENNFKDEETFFASLEKNRCISKIDEENYKILNKKKFLTEISKISRYITRDKLKEYAKSYLDRFGWVCLVCDREFEKVLCGEEKNLSYIEKSNRYWKLKEDKKIRQEAIKIFEELLEDRNDALDSEENLPKEEESANKYLKMLYSFLEVSDTELANVLPYEQAMQLSEFDKNLQDKLKQKYENAKKQHQTAFEQICNNINQGHITITTIQRCYGFDYGKANQIMNELIKKRLVEKVDANYEIISKEGLKSYFKNGSF